MSLESDKEWDPMLEAFMDRKFNSYTDGPAAQLDSALQPCFSRRPVSEKPLCKLYVHKIPSRITEAALRNLFQQYGRVVSLFRKEGTGAFTWAFVEYQNASEGQMAISGINGKAPLFIAVQFALGEEEKLRRRKEKDEEEFFTAISPPRDQPRLDPVMESIYPRSLGRGRGIPLQPRPSAAEIYSRKSQSHLPPPVEPNTYKATLEEESTGYAYHTSLVPGCYAPYMGGGWDLDNAFLMDRALLRVNASMAGRRITLGRGTIGPREKSHVYQRQNTYDLRHSDVDDRGIFIGKCSLCNDPSTLTCGVCGTWYCSSECQEEDWPHHKALCDCFRKALDLEEVSEEVEDVERWDVERVLGSQKGKMRLQVCGLEGDKGVCERWEGRQQDSRKEGIRGKREKQDTGNGAGDSGRNSSSSSGCGEHQGKRAAVAHERSLEDHPRLDSQRGKRGCPLDRGNGKEEVERRGCGGRDKGRDWRGGRGGSERGGGHRGGSRGVEGRGHQGPWGGRPEGQSQEREPMNQHANRKVDDDDEDWDSSKPEPVPREVPSANFATENYPQNYEEHVELPLGKFVEVNVEYVVARDSYWVTCKDYLKDSAVILEVLQRHLSKPSNKPFVPQIGSLCIASFENLPFRAKVKSIKGSKATVFFIDYGNTSECELAELIAIPHDALEFKSQAVQIVMSPNSKSFMNLPVGSEITVKAIKKSQSGVVLVEAKDNKSSECRPANVQGATDIPRATTRSVVLPPPMIALLQEGVPAACRVHDIIDEDDASYKVVVGMAFEAVRAHIISLTCEFPVECEAMEKDSSYEPSVGDFVAVKVESTGWLRGVVLGKEPVGWKVILCDEGVVMIEKEVCRIPERFKVIPCVSAECHVISTVDQEGNLPSEVMMVDSQLRLEVVSKRMRNGNPEVICNVMNTNPVISVKLLPWNPSELVSVGSSPTSVTTKAKPSSPPKNVVLKNGAAVKIVHFFNMAAIYVQPCDHKSQLEISKLLQSVTEACIPVGGKKPLREIPAKGSIVGCKFEADGNHYRALVVDVKSRDEIHVSYIDFGNLDVVKLDLMCEIPDRLKMVPAQAVRISLKDSFGNRMNKDVTIYLSELVINEEELKFICPNDNLKSCDLLLKNGSSLNDKLKEKMNMASKNSLGKPANPVIVEKVLQEVEEDVLPVPLDNESFINIQLVALSTPGKSMLVVCRKDHPLIRYVYEEFQMKINEVCEGLPDAPYVPRSNEICLAKFSGDGSWYRGQSVATESSGSEIYFLDFGNIELVKHADIRKMPQDLMGVPSLAIVCGYKGFTNNLSKEAESRLKELIQPLREYSARVWRRVDGEEDTMVDFPEITEKLIFEKHLDATLFRN
ncbi:uncharacterized protein [Hetaerina americana]|uniref:uncharacterized protein n=1 Tax=Hetaerina americana TaxID=62018 RepID=UPI003A7F526B